MAVLGSRSLSALFPLHATPVTSLSALFPLHATPVTSLSALHRSTSLSALHCSTSLSALHRSTSLSALHRSTSLSALLPLHATSVLFADSFPGKTGFLFFLCGRPELSASVTVRLRIPFVCHDTQREGREILDVNVLSTVRGHLRTKKEKGGRGGGGGGGASRAVAGGPLINFSSLKPNSPLTKTKQKKTKQNKKTKKIYMWGTYSSYIFFTFTT